MICTTILSQWFCRPDISKASFSLFPQGYWEACRSIPQNFLQEDRGCSHCSSNLSFGLKKDVKILFSEWPISPHISSYMYILNILDYFSILFMLIFLPHSLFEILRPVYGRILKLRFKLELKLKRVVELSIKLGHNSKCNLRLLYSAWNGTPDGLNSGKQIEYQE